MRESKVPRLFIGVTVLKTVEALVYFKDCDRVVTPVGAVEESSVTAEVKICNGIFPQERLGEGTDPLLKDKSPVDKDFIGKLGSNVEKPILSQRHVPRPTTFGCVDYFFNLSIMGVANDAIKA